MANVDIFDNLHIYYHNAYGFYGFKSDVLMIPKMAKDADNVIFMGSGDFSYSRLVSVVIATYNRADLIGETIDSILSQTFTDFELIIISDGSTDETEDVVSTYSDARIRYIRQDASGRPAVPRNRGIQVAIGKYIAFCDDDDVWLPNKLEKQLQNFPEDGISCVATDCLPIGDVRIIDKSLVIPSGVQFRDYSYQEILLNLNPVISSSVLVRKDFLLNVNGFDESSDFSFIEDWELWLRLCKKGKIRILAEPLLKYRMYQKKGRDARQVTLNTLKIVDKHETLGFMDCKLAQAARANCSVMIGKAFMEIGDRQGLPYYWRGFVGCSTKALRIRAFCGALLLLVPTFIRLKLVDLAYKFTTKPSTTIDKSDITMVSN